MSANDPEPAPTGNDRRPSWELVIEDMRERDRIGREKYGTPLQAFNGRDPLTDAYQECLDQAVYLRTAIEEREAMRAVLEWLRTDMQFKAPEQVVGHLEVWTERITQILGPEVVQSFEDGADRQTADLLVLYLNELRELVNDWIERPLADRLSPTLQELFDNAVRPLLRRTER